MFRYFFGLCVLSACAVVFGAASAFAQPVISVYDWDFGTCGVGLSVEESVGIINQGDEPLIITSVDYPGTSVFTIKAGTLPPLPFVIPPAGMLAFTVIFKPTDQTAYSDRITFQSNAEGNDPVCELWGNGIQPALTVTGFEWGRLRVDLGEQADGKIRLMNTGTASVRILAVAPEGHTNDFTIPNLHSVLGDLAPGQSRTLGVRFRPSDIGPREMRVIFQSTAGDRTALLAGTGVYARMITANYDFGTVVIPGGTPRKRDVEFTVDASSPYADPIEVTGLSLVEADNGYYSYDIANNLFRGDGTQVTDFPIVLQHGEKLILRDVTFAPVSAGSHSRSIRILTRDDTHLHFTNNSPVISEWLGEGRMILVSVGSADADGGTGTIAVYPNPVSKGESVQLRYNLQKGGTMNIAVTDLLGRPVYTWQGVQSEGGQHHFLSGIVQAGCYTINITVDGATAARSVIIVQ